jgi:hypothetical protein
MEEDRGMRDDLAIIHGGDGRAEGLAVGRGGVLPRPEIPLTTKDVIGIDLTHVIHTSDIAPSSAKPGGGSGGGGGGGGGGGTSFAPYIAGGANGTAGFDITINFSGSNWTQSLHNAFTSAANFYVSLISGDVPDVKVVGKGGPQTVDDIVINASLTNIDGINGILGQAGPTAVRSNGSLPATATMQFDIADAANFDAQHLFDDIVFHEMGHSLGFGSIWDRLGLVDSNSHFTGALANAHAVGGGPILVETDGGSGTAGSHWDETTYVNEIMTGYIDDPNYLSDMTAASYGVLGYQLAGNWQTVAGTFDLAL